MVVDDELIIQEVLYNYLSSERYSLQIASSGIEALTKVKEDKPDLIILDVVMPNMTGIEVCRRLRQDYSLTELPIIFLSARNQVNDYVVASTAGANDYLAKPVFKQELIARIQNQIQILLGHRRLKSCLTFSRKISEFKDSMGLIRFAFQQINSNMALSAGILLHGHVTVDQIGSTAILQFLKKEIETITNCVEEVQVKKINGAFAGEILYVPIKGFNDYCFYFFRKEINGRFLSTDLDYLQNIVWEVQNIRNNISNILQSNATQVEITKILHIGRGAFYSSRGSLL